MSEVQAPTPGAGARRIFERLRRARLARGESAPSTLELAYEKGAAGELELGRWLNAAAAERGGCWVLHDLVLGHQSCNIDHLVIGPAGVTAIDAKKWEGKVWIGRLGLGRGGRAFPHEVDGMSRQINRVHSLLARAGRDDVRVEGVICMVNDNEGIPVRGLAEVRGVRVGRTSAAIDHALRDGPCDVTTIERLTRVIQSAFTVNGGEQAPTPRVMAVLPPKQPAPRRVRRFPVRGARRLALACLAAMIALTIAAAVISGLDASVDRLAGPIAPTRWMTCGPTPRGSARSQGSALMGASAGRSGGPPRPRSS